MIGTRERPLTLADMPLTVPATGRYFLLYGDRVIELPEAPAGSVLTTEAEQTPDSFTAAAEDEDVLDPDRLPPTPEQEGK